MFFFIPFTYLNIVQHACCLSKKPQAAGSGSMRRMNRRFSKASRYLSLRKRCGYLALCGADAADGFLGRRVKIQRFSSRFALVAGFWLYILRSKGILAHSI